MKPTHPLIKAARSRKLFHPGRLDEFSQEQWLQFLDKTGQRDTESIGYISGVTWLNNHFHKVKNTRSQFSFEEGDRPPYQEMIRAHIAGANYAFWQVMDEQDKKYAAHDTPAIEQMLISKTAMVGESDPVGANNVIMHRLDSLRWPLFELMRDRNCMHKLFPDGNPESLSRLDVFLREMTLSQFYHNFSSLWQELLYGHALFNHQPGCVFFYQRTDYHRMKTVADFRTEHYIVTSMHEARFIQDVISIEPRWATYLFYEPGKPLRSMPWHLLSEKARSFAKFQPHSIYHQIEDHLKPLLKQKQEPGLERTLQSVLDVWLHLSVLAVQLDQSLHTDKHIRNWDALIALAPVFDSANLREILCVCTGNSPEEIVAALGLLTWQGSKLQEDLWAQPLILLEDKYVFPLSALLTASLPRNVDCWLSKIDPSDTRRGKLFEKHLVQVLKECRDENPVMKEQLRFTESVEIEYEEGKEEIDLTFTFGKLLVVAEARSSRKSITPLDYHNEVYDKSGLKHKTEQATRKAAFVQRNLKRFCRDYYPHLVNEEGVDVIPVVIINGQFHAGYPFNGVPVLDLALLSHYLRDGEIRFGSAPPYTRHQYGIPLWHTLEEAQARFNDYVACPTLIKLYDALCTESVNRSSNMGEGCEEVVTLGIELICSDWEQYLSHVKRVFPNQLIKYY